MAFIGALSKSSPGLGSGARASYHNRQSNRMTPTMPDAMSVEPLITTQWLHEHLGDGMVRVVDIRGYVKTQPVAPGVEEVSYQGAGDEYLAAHIPGAVYVDWTRDIVDPGDPVPAQIAPPETFARAMAARGIGDQTHVVAVD